MATEKLGLRDGAYVVVSVLVDGDPNGMVVLEMEKAPTAYVSVYIDKDEDLLVLLETLQAAYEAVKFQSERPRLSRLIEARIAELDAIEGEEGETNPPPPPTDGLPDLPF